MKNIGYKNSVNRAPVDKVLSATATFETLIAPKNVIQCKPMTHPIPKRRKNSLRLTFKLIFRKRRIKNNTTEAIATLYQVKGRSEERRVGKDSKTQSKKK